ncbi:hypothetical protein HG717_24680 [Rhodococcus erythropolis]|uniref:hypothetical protein n=1 Tax=Rhodococcus erythropolis TaxID=1833 RepID=UPI001C9A5DB2|nr:hypothetical protein [Rhodococcus erythropolis]MBY6387103.1 hypothetical protein [Rhodococcus erythropolis]
MTQLADQSTQSESQHDRRQLTEAWSAVTDSLATFGSTAAATGSPLDSAEGVRHALRLFGYLAEMNIERQDVLRPELFTLMSPMRKFWGDGIDVDYWTAMIDPNETYRIHGNRGTVPYVAVLANRVGASGTDRVADNIVIDDKVCDADGNFEIFVAQELEGRSGIRLDKRCFDVVVRVYHKTRNAEIDPVLHIERLGPPPGARPDLDTAWLAQRLTKLARGMDVSLRRSLQLIETLSQSPNEIRVTSEQRGWGDFYGTSSNRYIAGWWSLKDATAVDITFTLPDCTYFGVMLYNHWFESFEYRDHTVNLNDAHFERNDDGTVTIRIGGVEGDRNRLNPCNHTEGILLARCLEPAEDVTSPHVEIIR